MKRAAEADTGGSSILMLHRDKILRISINNAPENQEIIKMINYWLGELFCGPGGIALGAKLASKTVESAG